MINLGILIATIGKDTLFKTLDSVRGAVQPGDTLKIVFDDKSIVPIERFENHIKGFNCNVEMIMQSPNLGYWGHGIRNKYQSSFKDIDYIHHLDDDDIYESNSFPKAREIMELHKGKLIITRFYSVGKMKVWDKPQICFGNVGSPSGLIPYIPKNFGVWGSKYGGDYEFYETTYNNFGSKKTVFEDFFLVRVRPHVYGFS